MTYQQFEFEIRRLVSVYGERFFPEEKIKLIWRDMQDLPKEAAHTLFTRLISEFNNAPPVAKINEYTWELKKNIERAELQKKLKGDNSGVSCLKCRDTGQVLAIRKSDETMWAFLCDSCNLPDLLGMGPLRDESGFVKGHRPKWNSKIHCDEYKFFH